MRMTCRAAPKVPKMEKETWPRGASCGAGATLWEQARQKGLLAVPFLPPLGTWIPRGIAASSSNSSRTWKQTMSTEIPWEEKEEEEKGVRVSAGPCDTQGDRDKVGTRPGTLTVSARRPSMARG